MGTREQRFNCCGAGTWVKVNCSCAASGSSFIPAALRQYQENRNPCGLLTNFIAMPNCQEHAAPPQHWGLKVSQRQVYCCTLWGKRGLWPSPSAFFCQTRWPPTYCPCPVSAPQLLQSLAKVVLGFLYAARSL